MKKAFSVILGALGCVVLVALTQFALISSSKDLAAQPATAEPAVAAATNATTTSTTVVPTDPAAPVSNEPLPGYKDGLWREGQAMATDVAPLDLFLKYARGYRPEQPLNYSHVIHVDKNNIECTYCHSGVTKSSYATVPSLESCMGCHKLIRTDRPDIKKLKEAWDKGHPIEWEPVNRLPEHAYFTHERHIKAGVGCQKCHGQVQKMPRVEKVSSLKMGWCVSCHRERGASTDCATCHQ